MSKEAQRTYCNLMEKLGAQVENQAYEEYRCFLSVITSQPITNKIKKNGWGRKKEKKEKNIEHI